MKLKRRVLAILLLWDKKQRGWWYGYDNLKEDLWYRYKISIPISEIKNTLKGLYQDGLIEVQPVFAEDTGLLNGSGYFYKHTP